MKKETWSIGEAWGVVVTDNIEGFTQASGHIEPDYYGGKALICESVYRKKDACLISAAPDMLEALQNLENDDNSIPKHAWEMVQKAIAKATNNNEFNNKKL